MAAGAAGASIRLGVLTAADTAEAGVWLALFAVNVVGSGVVGIMLGGTRRWRMPDGLVAAVTVGFCGGLTTLSAMSVEVATAIRQGGAMLAAAWMLTTVVSCVGAAWLGRVVVAPR